VTLGGETSAGVRVGKERKGNHMKRKMSWETIEGIKEKIDGKAREKNCVCGGQEY